MLAIVLSFCAGAAISFAWMRLTRAGRARRRLRPHDVTTYERENALQALLVEHQMREMLGKPVPPYFTAEAVAEARRALQPMVVIRVKP